MPIPIAVEPPSPPSLPAFVREVPVLSIEHTSAVIGLGDRNLLEVTAGAVGLAHAAFLEGELPVTDVGRGWFVGARWGYVGSQVPGRPAGTFLASPEVWWRVAAVGQEGVSTGAVLALALPFDRDLDDEDEAALRTARVVRPSDDILLRDRTVSLRPAFDLRWARDAFVFQVRQGIDASLAMTGRGRLDLVAHGAIFAGFLPVPDLLVGAEVRDVYALTEQLADDQRAAVSLAPGMRARWGAVAPALSLEVPLSTPLGGEARAFVAVRLGVQVEVE